MVAQLDFLGEDFQLLDQNCGLNGIEPGIHADMNMLIAVRALAMHAQAEQKILERLVIGETGAPIAVTAQWFGRKETGGGCVADGAGALAVQQSPKALCRVAEEFQALTRRNRG